MEKTNANTSKNTNGSGDVETRDRLTSIIEVSMPLTGASARCRQQWWASHWQPASYSSCHRCLRCWPTNKRDLDALSSTRPNAGRGFIQRPALPFSADIAFRKGRSACLSLFVPIPRCLVTNLPLLVSASRVFTRNNFSEKDVFSFESCLDIIEDEICVSFKPASLKGQTRPILANDRQSPNISDKMHGVKLIKNERSRSYPRRWKQGGQTEDRPSRIGGKSGDRSKGSWLTGAWNGNRGLMPCEHRERIFLARSSLSRSSPIVNLSFGSILFTTGRPTTKRNSTNLNRKTRRVASSERKSGRTDEVESVARRCTEYIGLIGCSGCPRRHSHVSSCLGMSQTFRKRK